MKQSDSRFFQVLPGSSRFLRVAVLCGILALLAAMPAAAGTKIDLPELGGGGTTAQKGIGGAALVTESYACVRVLSDTLIAIGANKVLHSVIFSGTDAAATAGSIVLYDSVSESGTVLLDYQVPAAAVAPFTVLIDAVTGVGIYAGFTLTTDVAATVCYR